MAIMWPISREALNKHDVARTSTGALKHYPYEAWRERKRGQAADGLVGRAWLLSRTSEMLSCLAVNTKSVPMIGRDKSYENIGGHGVLAPSIIHRGTRWKSVANFTPQPLFPGRKSLRDPFDTRLGGHRAGLVIVERRKIFFVCVCREFNPNSSIFQPVTFHCRGSYSGCLAPVSWRKLYYFACFVKPWRKMLNLGARTCINFSSDRKRYVEKLAAGFFIFWISVELCNLKKKK
jgi:hypothetical protein